MTKPVLYVCNVDEKSVDGNSYTEQVKKSISDEFEEMLIISASIEADINDLETEDDKEFLNDLGLTEPGVNKVIRSAFNLLGLQTFLLLVRKFRTWTIEKDLQPLRRLE